MRRKTRRKRKTGTTKKTTGTTKKTIGTMIGMRKRKTKRKIGKVPVFA